MAKKTHVLINLKQSIYDKLKKLKWEHQKTLKKDRYSYGEFISFLCDQYETELSLNDRSPTIAEINELEV